MSHTLPNYQPFEHANTAKGPLYRAVMRVFVEHKRRFVVHLRPEDVVRGLAERAADATPGATTSLEEVENALDSLARWGNLRADPDTSRVASVEDFYRRRLLFQLTREGEAAERALAIFEAEIGRRGELQSVALEDIRLRLRSLHGLLGAPDPDPAVVHNLLLELTSRLDSLAANASAFMGGLQRVIDLQDLDEEAFFAYKDRLIAYLERFVADLVQKSYDIRQTLLGFASDPLEALLLVAARREASDAAPDGDDASDPLELRLDEWRLRWSGLASWFIGTRLQPSQSELLRRRASHAVPDLLAAIRLLQERRTGRSDRRAGPPDYRALALWFAQAGDAEAHRLWRTAFGVGSARHLTGVVGPAAEADGAEPATLVPPSTSWLDAPAVEVAARLRQTGRYQRRGHPTRVADRSAARAQLEARVAAERAQVEQARRRLATGRPTRLADLGGPDGLGSGELTLFLRLLGDALAAGVSGPDGVTRAVTSDGSYEVTLVPVPEGPVVAVRSTEGVIWAVDHTITIVDRTVPPSQLPAYGASGQPAAEIAEIEVLV
jgi:uncharacterized protein (TIGR02677 family)